MEDVYNSERVRIDTSLIPDYVGDRLADGAMDLYRYIISQPGGRELLKAKTAERKQRLAAKGRE